MQKHNVTQDGTHAIIIQNIHLLLWSNMSVVQHNLLCLSIKSVVVEGALRELNTKAFTAHMHMQHG